MTSNKNLAKLRDALKKAGLDYVVTRLDGSVAHVNVWVTEDNNET